MQAPASLSPIYTHSHTLERGSSGFCAQMEMRDLSHTTLWSVLLGLISGSTLTQGLRIAGPQLLPAE